jgi:cytochrome c2
MRWLLACVLAIAACGNSDRDVVASAARLTGGDAHRGQALLSRYGCGACHLISKVRGARGTVGPPLDALATRSFVAGRLDNSPENLRHYLEHPQAVLPGSAMPDMGVSHEDAQDLTAFLYTLR